MTVKKRRKNLSKSTRAFLAQGESEQSDFKRRPDGISADDLVSFANSESGGSILAGVDEQNVDKAQIGVVCGCDVSDATILQVLNKAVSCIPPVSVDIIIENLDDDPILRIDIPGSPTKPHCTPKGIYCRRDGARNRPLHPSELLRLFLDSEATAFAARFESAAERITHELSSLEQSLDTSIKAMADQLGWADLQLGDTESTLRSVEGLVSKLSVDTTKANSRLRALFRQDKRDDPVREKARLEYLNKLVNDISSNDRLLQQVLAGGELQLSGRQSTDSEITDSDANRLLQAAVQHLRKKERDKSYDIIVKDFVDCDQSDIKRFQKKVTDSGGKTSELLGRQKRALRLGYIIHQSAVVGVAAVSKPTIKRRAKIFGAANSEMDYQTFEYEFGWVYLQSKHREKGQMTRLVEELFFNTKNWSMFATTDNSDSIMTELLTQFHFAQDGTEYVVEGGAQKKAKLFVRQAPTS